MPRRDWKTVTEHAAIIAGSYTTSVTLRQLFYRLVAAALISNTRNDYSYLSDRTSIARRAGWFPALLDQGREIARPLMFNGPGHGLAELARQYRLDRTKGQEAQVWVVVEKATLVEQVSAWVNSYGLPVVACRGYSSQTLCDQVRHAVDRDGRKAVMLYVGDLDPTGEDIDRDFFDRTDCWDHVQRIAVLPDHIDEYGLVPMPGKEEDSRAAAFEAKHGALFQIEAEAIDPDDLRTLVLDAARPWVDEALVERIIKREKRHIKQIADLGRGFRE